MLPSQGAIANIVGASRASVREAVKTMEAQGLLRAVNGKGIFVENVDTSFYVGEMNRDYILGRLIDVLSVRKALEGLAVELCTLRATDGQLRHLSELLEAVEFRYAGEEAQSEQDLLFHQTLVPYSQNALLTHMLVNLMQTSSGIWNMDSSGFAPILTASIPRHREMMNHMLRRDAKRAVAVCGEYMNEEIERLSAMISVT